MDDHECDVRVDEHHGENLPKAPTLSPAALAKLKRHCVLACWCERWVTLRHASLVFPVAILSCWGAWGRWGAWISHERT